MVTGKGQTVCGGIVSGKVFACRRAERRAIAASLGIDEELKRYHKARGQVSDRLEALRRKTAEEAGEAQAQIIEVQQLMLEDQDLIDGTEGRIREGMSAAEAALQCAKETADEFRAMEDEYFRARAADILDVSEQLATALGAGQEMPALTQPSVIFAEDLAPSETLSFPRNLILGIVTRGGSSTSHTAILARMLNIPAIVQADFEMQQIRDGQEAAVDGTEGIFYLDPDAEILCRMEELRDKEQSVQTALEKYRGQPSQTRSGRKISLYANIGSAADAQAAADADAEGIGLMRSEFLYIGRDSCPAEEELYEAYCKVIETMGGRKVIIRTMDIGSDKQVSYFAGEPEENPALGYRGIRFYQKHAQAFKSQMRAIIRAAATGPVGVMFPMITQESEVRHLRQECERIRKELQEENLPAGSFEFGIMIETPAAALITDQLAKEVDFFSVGTNDLTQYTLAIDRQNAELSGQFDPHHPALLQLLSLIAQNARKEGIWAGICGELAADTALTEKFLDWGYEELSVSPASVLKLRQVICNLN